MTKRQLIDRITTINVSAHPNFLASFQEDDLQAYLDHLHVLEQPRLTGSPQRYEKYFTPSSEPQFIYDTPGDVLDAQTLTDEGAFSPQQVEDAVTEFDIPEQSDDTDLLQPIELTPEDEFESSSQERPLSPVMVGGREDDASYVSNDNESESWLF